jgi:hypothetical protein
MDGGGLTRIDFPTNPKLVEGADPDGQPGAAPPPVVVSSRIRLPITKGPETTRHIIAYVLVGSFFLIAGVPLFGIFGGAGDMTTKVTNAVEWLKGVSAYLAGLVGAVIGYYYRTEVEKTAEEKKTE